MSGMLGVILATTDGYEPAEYRIARVGNWVREGPRQTSTCPTCGNTTESLDFSQIVSTFQGSDTYASMHEARRALSPPKGSDDNPDTKEDFLLIIAYMTWDQMCEEANSPLVC